MKKLSAIILVLLLLTTTEAEQLLRLPMLVKHFISHSRTPGNTLIDFVANHYMGGDTDSDELEDNQLPFKTFDAHHLGFVYLGQQTVNVIAVPTPVPVIHCPQLAGRYIPGFSKGIFRPPQGIHTILQGL